MNGLNDQQMRRRAQKHCDEVRDMHIFKTRLGTDDGWRFAPARTRSGAARMLGVPLSMVEAAVYDDLRIIAARALTGRFD
jgi:hypothetical protein